MSKILLVDDSPFICSIITKVLGQEKFQVIAVQSAEYVFEAVHREKPDLILLDIILPHISGYEICGLLKKSSSTSEIPVIFVTSASDEKSVLKAFATGGVDYIQKPFSSVELLARVRAHIKNKEMTDLLRAANEELARTNQQLAEMLEEKRLWAIKDSLTWLYNRHYFTEMQPVWSKQAEAGMPVSILLMDVDDFKKVNDQYGHIVGDYVLCTIAKMMIQCFGERSTTVRWGGEEFVALLPSVEIQQAAEVAQRLRKAVEEYPFLCGGVSLRCTITMGAVQIDPTMSMEKNLARADEAMYAGKLGGKNCVVIA